LMDDDYVRIQNFELQQEQFPLLLLVQISCGVKYFQMEMFCTANFSPPDWVCFHLYRSNFERRNSLSVVQTGSFTGPSFPMILLFLWLSMQMFNNIKLFLKLNRRALVPMLSALVTWWMVVLEQSVLL
jgi:hypothetical protein